MPKTTARGTAKRSELPDTLKRVAVPAGGGSPRPPRAGRGRRPARRAPLRPAAAYAGATPKRAK
jgi:hypothetical protein